MKNTYDVGLRYRVRGKHKVVGKFAVVVYVNAKGEIRAVITHDEARENLSRECIVFNRFLSGAIEVGLSLEEEAKRFRSEKVK